MAALLFTRRDRILLLFKCESVWVIDNLESFCMSLVPMPPLGYFEIFSFSAEINS